MHKVELNQNSDDKKLLLEIISKKMFFRLQKKQPHQIFFILTQFRIRIRTFPDSNTLANTFIKFSPNVLRRAKCVLILLQKGRIFFFKGTGSRDRIQIFGQK
jgi:hypothetical protein